MKKIFYLASIAALALSSCTKDETTAVNLGTVGGSKIAVSMEDDATRTHFGKDTNGKWVFQWSKEQESIGVFAEEATENGYNVQFKTNGDGSANGIFTSTYKLLHGEKYMGYYPYSSQMKLTPEWDKYGLTVAHKALNYTYAIPEYQNYNPDGIIDSSLVPALSDEFIVDEDGNADVTMQPLTDYFFVKMAGTRPIKTITLQLAKAATASNGKITGISGNNFYTISGSNFTELIRYKNSTSGEYRYALTSTKNNNSTTATGTSITLNVGDTANTVCHDGKVYGFVIPAGILGCTQPVYAKITVNKDTELEETFYVGTASNKTATPAIQLVGDKDHGRVVKTTTSDDGKTTTITSANMNLENQIFWANAADEDGEREEFMYNPENDAILYDQVDVLMYLKNYNNDAPQNAFVCAHAELDFSAATMQELATENEEENLAVSDFISYGLPCVPAYNAIFNGNGVTFEGIWAIQSEKGIFGTLGKDAVIKDITLSNLTAADKDKKPGTLIGTSTNTNGKIDGVAVVGTTGLNVMAEGNVDHYNGFAFDEVEGLDNIFATLNLNKALDMTETWDEVSAIGEGDNVFGEIEASANWTAKNKTVITVPEAGATAFDKLAFYIWQYNDTNKAVATVFDGVSFWTGSRIAPTVQDTNTSVWDVDYAEEFAYLTNISHNVVLTSDIDLNYANLAADALEYIAEDSKINVKAANGATTRVPELWTSAWETVTFTSIDGDEHTVTGVVMNWMGTSSATADSNNIAPLAVSAVKDLTVDGVSINIVTNRAAGIHVPAQIAGLTINAKSISGVTVDNLAIKARDVDDPEEGGLTEVSPSYNVLPELGWVAVTISNEGVNTKILSIKDVTANVVSSNLKASAAMFVNAVLADQVEMQLTNCTTTLADAVKMTALAEVEEYDYEKATLKGAYAYNAAANPVFCINNTANEARSIKIVNCGNVVYTWDAYDKVGLNVFVDGKETKHYGTAKLAKN